MPVLEDNKVNSTDPMPKNDLPQPDLGSDEKVEIPSQAPESTIQEPIVNSVPPVVEGDVVNNEVKPGENTAMQDNLPVSGEEKPVEVNVAEASPTLGNDVNLSTGTVSLENEGVSQPVPPLNPEANIDNAMPSTKEKSSSDSVTIEPVVNDPVDVNFDAPTVEQSLDKVNGENTQTMPQESASLNITSDEVKPEEIKPMGVLEAEGKNPATEPVQNVTPEDLNKKAVDEADYALKIEDQKAEKAMNQVTNGESSVSNTVSGDVAKPAVEKSDATLINNEVMPVNTEPTNEQAEKMVAEQPVPVAEEKPKSWWEKLFGRN